MPPYKPYDGTFDVVVESVTTRHGTYPIRPEHIQEELTLTFGKAEVEWAAERLITFFKDRGCWCGFTLEELKRFYEARGWETDNMFFGLLGAWFDDGMAVMRWREPADVFFAITERGVYFVTDRFIERCAGAVRPGETTAEHDERLTITDELQGHA